ncbi:MAG: M13 family metallopeptidase, partial [Propionibacteriaceae bacterium]|nr:M13 family metallopeptidase [Propionibacteriaceae bacterium]
MTNSGIVTQYFDQTSRPQDDLFRHVNGQWLDNYDIPPDRGADGAFRELHDAAEQQVRLIIEEANGQAAGDSTEATEERLIAALYASFMDADQVERRGLEPLQADIAAVAEADKVTLAKVIGQLERTGVGGLFDTWVDNDPGQPTRYIVNLSQGGLGLPDEAYYREDQHAEIRQHYVGHVAAMLDLATAGDANPVG